MIGVIVEQGSPNAPAQTQNRSVQGRPFDLEDQIQISVISTDRT
jgi:hypothetical protein